MLLPWCKVGDIPTPWPGLAWPVSCATPLIRGCPHFRPYIFGGFENMGEREIKGEVWSERGMAHTFLPLAFLTKGEKYPLWYSEPVPHSLSLSFSPFFCASQWREGRKKPETKGSRLIWTNRAPSATKIRLLPFPQKTDFKEELLRQWPWHTKTRNLDRFC